MSGFLSFAAPFPSHFVTLKRNQGYAVAARGLAGFAQPEMTNSEGFEMAVDGSTQGAGSVAG